MRIYFDNCSLQRPLDDKAQPRILLEAKAIGEISLLCESGDVTLVSSDVLEIEVERTPQPQRRKAIFKLLTFARDKIALSEEIAHRAEEFETRGIKAFDALHLALAEAGQIDYFCTCDDKFLKKARAQNDLKLRVVSPLELAREIFK